MRLVQNAFPLVKIDGLIVEFEASSGLAFGLIDSQLIPQAYPSVKM